MSFKSQSFKASAKGFTILEVLIALIIFALVSTAISKSLALAANAHLRVNHRTFATMIAQNTIAELRLSESQPAVGQSKKDLKFASLDWKLITKVSATEDAKLMRVDLEISRILDSGEQFKELEYVGFVADTQ